MADFDSAEPPNADVANIIRNVTIKMFRRASDHAGADYELSLSQVGMEVAGTTAIGWCFPDGTASLDRVEIDGVTFEGEKLDLPIKDAGLKDGSTVKVYTTELEEEDEGEAEEGA